MNRIIDVHAHLCADELAADLDALLTESCANGIVATIAVCESPLEFERARSIARKHPDSVALNFGLHPVQHTVVDDGAPSQTRSVNMDDLPGAITAIEMSIDDLVGIGEVGLDFSPNVAVDARCKEDQRAVLRAMVELSLRHDLPLNVHSRSAGRPTIQLLAESGRSVSFSMRSTAMQRLSKPD
eukprot:Opistho-2@80935